MTQATIILKVLRDAQNWVPSYHLQKVNTKYGWLGSSGDRSARRLAEGGLIERKQEGKYAYYRALEERTKTYNVMNNDGTIQKTITLVV